MAAAFASAMRLSRSRVDCRLGAPPDGSENSTWYTPPGARWYSLIGRVLSGVDGASEGKSSGGGVCGSDWCVLAGALPRLAPYVRRQPWPSSHHAAKKGKRKLAVCLRFRSQALSDETRDDDSPDGHASPERRRPVGGTLFEELPGPQVLRGLGPDHDRPHRHHDEGGDEHGPIGAHRPRGPVPTEVERPRGSVAPPPPTPALIPLKMRDVVPVGLLAGGVGAFGG